MHATAVAWRARAACRGTDPALFYDLHPLAIATAKTICAVCPVRAECRTDAHEHDEEFGVWGGLAAHERPPATRTVPARPGQPAAISDDELVDVMADADPARPAVEQLLAHRFMSPAAAYRALERGVALGVVEHRGRALFPTRR